jgi:hypothetical protein
LLIILSSGNNEEYWGNFTNDDEMSDNSTMLYELNANSMRNQGNQTTLHYNLHSVKNESETMLHELNENYNEHSTVNIIDDNIVDDNIVLYEMCNETCMQYCCYMMKDNCNTKKMIYIINNNSVSMTLEDAIDYSCEENIIPFDIMNNENTMFFDNSSLNLSRHDRFISLMSKCFRISSYAYETCVATVTKNLEKYIIAEIYFDIIAAILIVSLLGLLMTFIVYSICPELQNMHGYALRSYVVSWSVVHTIFLIIEKDLFEETYPVCVAESTVLRNNIAVIFL